MKIVLVILSTCFPLFVFCQLEFAPIGAKWTYEGKWFDWMTANISYSLFIIESEKDTTIQNKNFKKLLCYVVYKNSNGDKVRNYLKNQFVYQDKYLIYHLVNDSIVKIFDFNPKIGRSFYYLGWNIFADNFNFSQLEYIILKNSPDSSYSFLPNKIEAKITCSVSQGLKIVMYEKFGFLSDILFYSDAYCSTDQQLPYTLRCYEDFEISMVKFDSIECDSIRPDIIRTKNVEIKDRGTIAYNLNGSNQIVLINNSKKFINEVYLFTINGILIQTDEIRNSNLDNLINIGNIKSGLYIIALQFQNGDFISDKIIVD